jgi:hypothetical protein
MLLVVDDNQSVPTLLMKKINIVESGLFFKTDMPIIILQRNFLDAEEGYSALLNLFERLKNLKDREAYLQESLKRFLLIIEIPVVLSLKGGQPIL